MILLLPLLALLPPRIADRIVVDRISGCWLWTGPTDRDGYGRIGGRQVHRAVWELLRAPIPPGLVLDHREDWGCRSKACCCPGHLLPVTNAINTMREGTGVGAVNAAKDRCDHGHEFDLINTYYRPNGHRDCRVCIRRRVRKYQRRVRAGRRQLAVAALRVACRSGLGAADCALEHWCPPLGGRAERAGWRAPCPVCRTLRALSFQAKGKRVIWNAHCDLSCDREVIAQAVRSLVPCASTGRRAKKPAADLDELQRLALDKSLGGMALRLGLLRALGVSEEDAVQALDIPPRTLRWARQELAKNARSSNGKILPLIRAGRAARSCPEPQVKTS